MPRGDRTGPQGLGPRTGRAMGLCSGNNMPGYMAGGRGLGLGRGGGFGRGFGRGGGFGRGFGWRSSTPVQSRYWEPVYGIPSTAPSKQEEIRLLEEDAKVVEQEQSALKRDLEGIRKRIEELKK